MKFALAVLLLIASPVIVQAQIAVGERIQVTQDVAVRPSPGGALSGTQLTGAQGVVVSGPGSAWGLTWWQVNFDAGVDGWVTADRLGVLTVGYPGPVSVLQATREDVWTVTWTWAPGGIPALTVVDLERGPTATGPWTPLITTTAGAVSYDDRAVVTGQRYCWRGRGRIGTDVTPFSGTGICMP